MRISNFQTSRGQVTPTLPIAALASGQVLFDAVAVNLPGPTHFNSRRGSVDQLVVIDKGQKSVEIDFYFFSSGVTFGTPGAVPTISAADALKFVGKITVSAWDDIGSAVVSRQPDFASIYFSTPGTALYVAAVVNGAATFAADDLTIAVSAIIENVATSY
jgi:hypothetical protein